MKYAIASIKGGTSKSTLATNITVELNKKETYVAVDMDDTNSTTGIFFSERKEECLECMDYDSLANIANSNENIVFDLGGIDSDLNRAVLSICDVIVIPYKKGKLEENSLVNFFRILNEIGDIVGKKRLILVPSQFHFANTYQNIKDEVKELLELGFELSQPVYLSSNYVKAIGDNQTVYEIGAMKQALEISELVKLIEKD